MDKLKKHELKKLIKEYEYLLSQSEYNDIFIDEYRQTFLTEISKRRGELGLTQPNESKIEENLEPPIENIDNEEEGEVTPLQKKLKKLFKEIAKKVHPDKEIDEEKKKNCQLKMIHAKSLLDSKDILGLYIMSIELGIDIEIDDSDIIDLYKVISKRREEMQTLETSYLWLWVKSKSEEEKIQLIDLFIKTHG